MNGPVALNARGPFFRRASDVLSWQSPSATEREIKMPQWKAEENTPVCSLNAFQARYMQDWHALYAPFLKELGVAEAKPGGFSQACTSRKLYTEVNQGVRRMDWCPGGLKILDHLYPFFLARNMDIAMSAILGTRLGQLQSQAAWFVLSDRVFRNDGEHREHASQSGFFEKLVLPDAVQMAFLVAAAVYRRKAVPFASRHVLDLTYARTSTRLPNGTLIAVAYVPERALRFIAVSEKDPPRDLVTADAFVLP
jgi:hypothetical protein